MKLSIRHDTTYHFDDPVRTSIQYLRLTPQANERQRVLNWQLDLPRPARAQLDPYGNILHVLTLEEPHETVSIRASGQVEIDEGREAEHDGASPLPYLRFTPLTQPDEPLRDFALAHRRSRDGLVDLMHAIGDRMTLTADAAPSLPMTAAEAFASGRGISQDHTHAFLACARSLGVPARYVSGYLYTERDTHLSSHAWAEAWIGDAWYSFDTANGLARPERHLKVAVGLDYLDACPVRGMRLGGTGELLSASLLATPEDGDQ